MMMKQMKPSDYVLPLLVPYVVYWRLQKYRGIAVLPVGWPHSYKDYLSHHHSDVVYASWYLRSAVSWSVL
jgi:hypothetical protein